MSFYVLRTSRRAEGTSTNAGSKCEVTFVIQAKNGSKSFEVRRRSHYRKHTLLKSQNRASESLKSSFGCSKSTAGASKVDPVMVYNRKVVLKSAHDCPKIASAPRPLKNARGRPKSSPRVTQVRPTGPREASRGSPESSWRPF